MPGPKWGGLASSATFAANLTTGLVGEGAIARWLRAREWSVLPVYEMDIDSGKGPRLFMPDRPVVATDMFVFRQGDALWVEAKTKTVFTWRRLPPGPQWETGIDLRHYREYQTIDEHTPWPVWLLFLHTQSEPDERDVRHGCPPECPTGLFGNKLSILRTCESHRSDKHGPSGMVYWGLPSLRRFATLEQMGLTA